MNCLRNNKGITLLALVITIIVLVILGGTVLGLAIGNDGIIGKTLFAAEETKKARVKEDVEIMLANYVAERENNGTTLKQYFEDNNIEYYVDEDGNYVVENNGFETAINPLTLELNGPDKPDKKARIIIEPKIVEPGENISVELEFGKKIKVSDCKYAFIKKTENEVTENEIEEAIDPNNLKFNISTTGLIGDYSFYLLVAYTDKDTKVIKHTDVIIGKAVETIELNETSAEIKKGKTLQLEATVTPDDASLPDIIWTTDNSNIASVSADGLVTAKAVGTTTIYANATDGSGVKTGCEITVSEILATGITLDAANLELGRNEQRQLTATIAPADVTNSAITWASSDEKVATVDSNGLVKAVGGGTAKISATTKDGTNIKVECTVTVAYNYMKTGLQVYLDSKASDSRLSNSWIDQSGKGNNAALYGCTWKGGALYFDGSNDYAAIGYKDYPNVTIEVIIKASDATSNKIIAGNPETGGSYIGLREGKFAGRAYYNSAWVDHLDTVAGVTNTMIKYTITVNNSSAIFYKNGTKVTSTNTNGYNIEMPNNNTVFMLGANPNKAAADSGFYNGYIYLVRVYDRALSENEVKENYNYDNNRYNINSTYYSNLSYDDSSYTIGSLAELKSFRDKVDSGNTFSGKYVELTADINLSSVTTWNSIGGTFSGIFNGNGHKISGLKITGSNNTVGLFASCRGIIENLTIESGSVSGGQNVGGICAYLYQEGSIANCVNKASISSSGQYTGGIVGVSYGLVQRCSNYGTVTSTSVNTGGIVGAAFGDRSITKFCTNNSGANVQALYQPGGVVGYCSGLKISSCSNAATITATSNSGSTGYCGMVGGIVSIFDHSGGYIEFCKNTGTITCTDGNDAGGIAGQCSHGTVQYCYNRGSVTASHNNKDNYCFAGGILSRLINNSEALYCYNAGQVKCTNSSGTKYPGGIVGLIPASQSSKVTSCYTLSTYGTTIVARKSSGTVTTCTSKTDAQMKAADFITLLNGTGRWIQVSSNYPKLYWE